MAQLGLRTVRGRTVRNARQYRANAEHCAENPVPDRLLVELEQLGDLGDRHELVLHCDGKSRQRSNPLRREQPSTEQQCSCGCGLVNEQAMAKVAEQRVIIHSPAYELAERIGHDGEQ
jgi:hypothetical protein